MRNPSRLILVSVLFASICAPCSAQNLLPNPGLEEGAAQPLGWKISGGAGEWSPQSHSGERSLMVEGTGKNSTFWRTETLALRPGGLYRLSFYARREASTSGGCVISGLSRVNRDFRPSESWERYSFVFSIPDNGASDYVRLGQWETKGRVFFDDVELCPVLDSSGGWSGSLAEGETIENGLYRFQPDFGWTGANYHRPLFLNRASFNSERWVFSPGAELIYAMSPGNPQLSARINVAINHYTGGSLRVEASADAKNWQAVASYDGNHRNGATNLPASLFPAERIYVRLSMPENQGNLQVNSFTYETTGQTNRAGVGSSDFLDCLECRAGLDISLSRMGLDPGERSYRCLLQVSGDSLGSTAKFAPTNLPSCHEAQFTLLNPAQKNEIAACVSLARLGTQQVYWRIADAAGQTAFLGRSEARLGFLNDPRPGYFVADSPNLDAWWAESGWKIGKEMMLPPAPKNHGPISPLTISAAQGEYEAAQVVLRPRATATTLRSVNVGNFSTQLGATAPISVRVSEVGYVQVTHPTDSTCQRGWYPDPLPPLKTPLTINANENSALWVTFYVPRGVRPGTYSGELTLETRSEGVSRTESMRIPLKVNVYAFEIPRETHLRSALGLGTREINRYHNLTTPEDKQAVYEKYLRNFAEHRVSPYSFFDYAPIDIRFTGGKTNPQARVDFSKFDTAAAKWIDEYKLNTFLLPLRGMGGGTFHSRSLGQLEGYHEGTPEHARLFNDYLGQVERHLRERGWLDEAYAYWFDEPDPKDYEFVVAGMKRIKAAAPGLKRMLTEQPEAELAGHVEIWCGLTPEWTREKVAERRKAGEDVWWYICCGPTAPYITEFIDHPGTELRLWPWQSWQYDVQGILIWATIYWTSSSAFPPPKLQDPWTDPMSYVSGYSFGAGHIGYWGNGDGRFLYPPRRSPGANQPPCLDEPINSVRWENLRDGMEDYEYFWLLKHAIERAEQNGTQKELTRAARELLTIPEEISKDLTHFTTDPRLIRNHRDRVARMIEQLKP